MSLLILLRTGNFLPYDPLAHIYGILHFPYNDHPDSDHSEILFRGRNWVYLLHRDSSVFCCFRAPQGTSVTCGLFFHSYNTAHLSLYAPLGTPVKYGLFNRSYSTSLRHRILLAPCYLLCHCFYRHPFLFSLSAPLGIHVTCDLFNRSYSTSHHHRTL